MSAKRRRTPRDARRRTLGQNFLADRSEIDRLIGAAEIKADDLIMEIGAGTGSLTLPMAQRAGRVIAIERDPVWAGQLRRHAADWGLGRKIEVVEADFRQVPLPDRSYRVVANPPFGRTTAVLSHLLDDPRRGPWRADLLLQFEVARKRAASPPTTLRSAAWSPWWEFSLGPRVHRSAFRPVPAVDAAVLVARRRDPDVLPDWMATRFRELLRSGWDPPGSIREP